MPPRATNLKAPHVLMFGWEFPPYNSGGLGVACEGLTKALSASGVDLTFVLPFRVPVSASWCKFAFADEPGTEIISDTLIQSMFAGYSSLTVHDTRHTLTSLPVSMKGSLYERVMQYGKAASHISKKNNHSIIHAHDWLTYPAGIAAQKVSGKPFLAHVHATEFDRGNGESVNRKIYDIEREGFRSAQKVLAVSKRTRQKIIERYGISGDKVEVVYNGIDFANRDFGVEKNLSKLKSEGYSVVLFVGRITFQKGPDYFVRMAQKVLDYEPKTIFIVSGSGDMESQMIQMVAERGLSSKFIFCGFLRGDDLSRIYAAADMFVMPSVSEPFGLVPLEAMISKVPVLVSKESGVSEILNTALKSHFWDIDDMTDKVVAVLRNAKLKNHLSESGNKEVKNIHWKKAVERLVSVYNSLDDAFGMFLFSSPSTTTGAKIPGF